MMKEPVQAGAASSALGNPAVMVVLVLMLGATVYLWRTGYMRPLTAYVIMAILVLALVAVGTYNYFNPT